MATKPNPFAKKAAPFKGKETAKEEAMEAKKGAKGKKPAFPAFKKGGKAKC